MIHMIDEPTPFEGLQVWQAFLARLERITPVTENVEGAIQNAKAQIKQLEAL